VAQQDAFALAEVAAFQVDQHVDGQVGQVPGGLGLRPAGQVDVAQGGFVGPFGGVGALAVEGAPVAGPGVDGLRVVRSSQGLGPAQALAAVALADQVGDPQAGRAAAGSAVEGGLEGLRVVRDGGRPGVARQGVGRLAPVRLVGEVVQGVEQAPGGAPSLPAPWG